MSAPGYAPQDDEEQEFPSPGPTEPPPFVPGQDAPVAPPPLAPVPGAAVAPAPAPAPAMAPAPSLAPTALPPATPPGGPLDVGAEMRGAYRGAQQNENDAVAAERAKGAANVANAGIDAQTAQKNADQAAENERLQNQVLQQANARTQQWADQNQANYEKYLQAEPHDYWADKSTGNKVLAGLAIMTGAMGRTSNADNPGLQMVNQAIERDYRLQKDRIEKLKSNYEMSRQGFADATTAKTAALADLKLKMAAKYETTAAQATALKMKQGMSLAQAQTDADVVSIRQKGAAARLDALKDIHGAFVQDENLKIAQAKERDEHLRAQAYANHLAAAAKAGKSQAQQDKEVAAISKEFGQDETRLMGSARSPGLIQRQQDIRELGNNLRQASASGDPQAMAAAVVAAKEKIARLNTGAAPSHEQMKLLDSLTGTPAEIETKVKRLFGDPSAASQTMSGVLKLVDQADENALQEIDTAHKRLNEKYNGPHGIAKTAAQREHIAGRFPGLFGGVTTRTEKGEQPRYQESGAPSPPSAAPAATAPAAPAPTKLSTRDLALKVLAEKTIKDPKSDPSVVANAHAFLKRIGAE